MTVDWRYEAWKQGTHEADIAWDENDPSLLERTIEDQEREILCAIRHWNYKLPEGCDNIEEYARIWATQWVYTIRFISEH